MNLIIFLAVFFLSTICIGRLLEKFRVPWVFSSLLIGLGLSIINPFVHATSSSSFKFFAELGMFFLLFIIGFELNIKKVFKSSKFIFKTTFVIIAAETLLGTLFVHYVFGIPWLVSILIATSFATVGEAVLLPILDEFKLVRTKLGQSILSIGMIDDFIEVITVVVVSVVLGRSAGHASFDILINLLVLASLFALVYIIVTLREYLTSFKYKDVPSFFIFVIFFIFLFVGIGQLVESAALGAFLAGIALKNMIPKKILGFIDSEIKTLAYGFFAPLFFLWVGLDIDISYIIQFPLLVIAALILTNGTKVLSSYFMGKKVFGSKKSIIMGLGLSVKFSTSIVILKLLFEKGLIQSDLYSILIGSTSIFLIIAPILFSYLITKWDIIPQKRKKSGHFP